jgi:hypothetical protein
LIYVTDGEEVTLVALAGAHRDPDYWVERLNDL